MAKFMRAVNGTEDHSAGPVEEIQTPEPAPAPQPQQISVRPPPSADVSIISASLKVTGNLESAAEIRLEGKVEGDVRGKVVTVGESATVTGSVYGETVNLAGTIDGKVEGKNVVVSKTAHSTGDIIHESLQIEAGAYVDGHCRPQFGKSDAKAAQPKAVDQPSRQAANGTDKAPAAVSSENRLGA